MVIIRFEENLEISVCRYTSLTPYAYFSWQFCCILFFKNHMLFQRLLGYYSMCTHVHVCPHLWTNMIGNGRDQLIAQNPCMYCFPHFTDKVSRRLGLLGIRQLSGRSGISNLAGHIFKFRLLLSFQSIPSVFKLTSALTSSILLWVLPQGLILPSIFFKGSHQLIRNSL